MDWLQLIITFLHPNATSGCTAATAIINVKDSVRNPVITLVSVTPNTDCGGGLQIGGLEVIVDSQYDHTEGFLTFQWTADDFAGVNVSTQFPGVTDTEATLSNVPEGNYTITVNNTNTGCSSSVSYNVPREDEDLFITDYSLDNISYCVDNGSFAVTEISI